jgi:NAD(P)-dependent dehydrogenase (short-subunit alcohol dehydrogenase family)
VQVLINNAGVYGRRPALEEFTEDDFQLAFRTNALGPFFVVQQLLLQVSPRAGNQGSRQASRRPEPSPQLQSARQRAPLRRRTSWAFPQPRWLRSPMRRPRPARP